MERKRTILRKQAEQSDGDGIEATFRRDPNEPKSRVQLIMPARVHKQLKLLAVEDDTTVTALILEAIDKTYPNQLNK